MSETHYSPTYLDNQFNCSLCGVFAKQSWGNLKADYRIKPINGNSVPLLGRETNLLNGEKLSNDYVISRCEHCKKDVIWFSGQIVYPEVIIVELPNNDLTQEIKDLYIESASILNKSPRAAAALLRLGLQLLLKDIGGKGKNINDDIATVISNGVDQQVKKALDILRVFGNNGAHPGEIDLKEDNTKVIKMFALLNFVADKMITQQKEIDSLFDGLPETVKKQINDRDTKV